MGDQISRRKFLGTAVRATAAGVLIPVALSPLEQILAQPGNQGNQPQVEKIDTTGTHSRFNIVFLPEGYEGSQRRQFNSQVEQIIAALDNYPAMAEIKPWLAFSKIWEASTGPYKGDGTGPFSVVANKDSVTGLDIAKVNQMEQHAKADLGSVVINNAAARGLSTPDYASTSTNIPQAIKSLAFAFDLGPEKGDTDLTNWNPLPPNISKDAKYWDDLIKQGFRGLNPKLIGQDTYRAESGACMMQDVNAGRFGDLCGAHLYLRVRQKSVPLVKSATEQKNITIEGRGTPNIEVLVNPSASQFRRGPDADGFYVYADLDDKQKVDELYAKLKDEADPEKIKKAMKDAGFRRSSSLRLSYDSRGMKYTLGRTRLRDDKAYLLAIAIEDTHPNAKILDANREHTRKTLLYRVDVKEK